MKVYEVVKDKLLSPMSLKNLRITAILIGIYQVIIAHVFLFVMLLGLAHAEEMIAILSADIEDQKEREEIYFIPTNSRGESINQIRFKSASHLATLTSIILYIGTTIAGIYLICSLCLLIGTLKNRVELMGPWIVFDAICGVSTVILMIIAFHKNNTIVEFTGGKVNYWIFCVIFCIFNSMMWIIVNAYYINVVQMSKLREVATVAIPCPAVPHHYREHHYLGDGGLKHTISDNYNYVV